MKSNEWNLLEMCKVKLSKVQKMALQRIQEEGEEIITFLAKKIDKECGNKRDDEYYQKGCLALKQYYATAVLDPIHVHAISSELDNFWHAHILDTVSYNMLCEDLGVYMHHDPLNPEDKSKYDDVLSAYKYTRGTVLEKLFGEENLDSYFHPIETRAVCLHDVDRIKADVLLNDSPFNENTEMLKIKSKYGHRARKSELLHSLTKKVPY